jgi:hypothetical protein
MQSSNPLSAQVLDAIEPGGTAQARRTGRAVDPRTGAAGASPLCAAGAARPGHSPWVGGSPVWRIYVVRSRTPTCVGTL